MAMDRYFEEERKADKFEAQMREALNILRLARKESSQAFVRASYSKGVQSVFDELDALARLTGKKK